MGLEPGLRAAFNAGAKIARQPASPVLCAKREYDAFLRRKVEASRAPMRDGLGCSNEEIEVEFALRRTRVGS